MFNGKNHSMIYKVLSLVFGGIIILFIFYPFAEHIIS